MRGRARRFREAAEVGGPGERRRFDLAHVGVRLLGRFRAPSGNALRALWRATAEVAGEVEIAWAWVPSAGDVDEFRGAIGPAVRRRVMELVEVSVGIPLLRMDTPARWTLYWPADEDGPGPEEAA